MFCVEEFGVGLREWVCAVCGRVWCGFVEGGACCVWESLVWVWRMSLCCVRDSLVWVCWSECVLCGAVCSVFGRESLCCVLGSL